MFKFKSSFFILMSIILFCMISVYWSDNVQANDEKNKEKLVFIIPVEDEVERGLEAFITRSIDEAYEIGADHIIFEIDTPGGRVDAAGQIGKQLQELDIPSTAFIVNEALSAGSYIALNTDEIYMKPNATMGASGVITSDGKAADKKAQSAWVAAMKSAAESQGIDPLYAEAMADPNIDLPEFGAPKGEYLTLTPNNAVKVDYSKDVINNREALLDKLDLSNATIKEANVSIAESIARFVTSPVVIPILLSVASLGLIAEIYTPGFGVAGSMGLIALGLFFYGHFIAGLAGMETIILLIAGIILVVLEFFVSGGILGAIGVGSIIASLFMAGYDVVQMAFSLSIASIIAIFAAIILFKWVGTERGFLKKIILSDRTTTELGYVSSDERTELIGAYGTAVTGMRPAGTMQYGDERIDVVSEGTFINKDSHVKVINVEGNRIVVREVDE